MSALSYSIFNIIGLVRTSQEYCQRYLRTDKNYHFCINFIKIKPIFGNFVIRYRFLMLFDAGLSFVRNQFWVHIWCLFDILKYRAALSYTQLKKSMDQHKIVLLPIVRVRDGNPVSFTIVTNFQSIVKRLQSLQLYLGTRQYSCLLHF